MPPATCGKKKRKTRLSAPAEVLKTGDQIFTEETLKLYNAKMQAYTGPGLPPSIRIVANGAGVDELGYDEADVARWLFDHRGAAAQHARDVFGTSESFGVGCCGSLFMRNDITLGGYRTRFCLVGVPGGGCRPQHVCIMLDATFRPTFVYPLDTNKTP